ncbi:MAG: RTX toxin [Chloroflexi bacterium]|nr:RTX toxin [Chloroflexota bacterium]
MVGAINAVTPHPTDADIMYVGAVNGGIWRTNDATAANPNWANQTDNEQSLSIGALEFDPTDSTNQTLVAGTGRFSSLARQGGNRIGLLRTTNGATWTEIDGGGTIDGLNISGVAPRDATIVVSANTADTLGNRGIWRSTDTGALFTQMSGAAGSGLPVGPSFDLVGDPNNNSRLYTNAGGNGIYRSDNTGATWTKVSNATMDGLISSFGNVEIAVGSNQNVFVAIVQGSTLAGLFRSPNSGGTWTALDLPQTTENGTTYGIHPGGQGRLHLSIAADPSDDNVVYIGGDRQPCFTENFGCRHPVIPRWPNSVGATDFSGRLYRVDASLAAGSQATPMTHTGTASSSSPHADSRDMDVRADGVLVEGDDGGIYRRTTPRSNTGNWFSMNGDIQTTEFHNISWDAVNDIVIGGAQDTGTPQQVNENDVTWQSVATADGGDVAVDDTSTPGRSVRYSSSQFLGNFRRRVYDSTNTLQSQVFLNLAVVPPAPIGNPPVAQFYTPIELNNVNATRLIVGAGNSVYESLDQGNTVSEIGVGITANDRLGNDAIAYGATGNANMLYVGSGTRVFIRNAAAPAALTASATYPGTAQVVDIAIDPGVPNTAFVVDNANVFHTDDGGATWTDVTGNLGTLNVGTVRAVAFRGSGIVAAGGGDLVAVGTDNGVYSAGATTFDVWAEHSCNLPNVPVYDLDYDPVDRVFVAGTFGRGAWVLHE